MVNSKSSGLLLAFLFTAVVVRADDPKIIIIEPNVLNLVVGESHVLQALNPDCPPATGLTWLSSDTNIVSLSADDPPVLTAVAAGQATITAGSGSAVVTVYAEELPLGTTIWSNPGVRQMMYALPI